MSRIGTPPDDVQLVGLQPGFSAWTDHHEVGSESCWSMHRHEVHELLWGARGTLTVQTPAGFYVVPATLGLWLPAWTPHLVTAAAGTAFYCTYVAPEVAGGAPPDVRAVTVSTLVRELLLHLGRAELSPASRRRAEELACDLLQPVHLAPTDLPLPEDARALEVARGILRDPADDSSLELWGRKVGASSRTLSRLFAEQVGMTFAQWRTLARVRVAAGLLASGLPVTVVAGRVGYRTPSAFVAVFRRVMGRTPGAFGAAERLSA